MLCWQDPSVYNGNIGHYEDCCCLESDAFSLVLHGVTRYKTISIIWSRENIHVTADLTVLYKPLLIIIIYVVYSERGTILNAEKVKWSSRRGWGGIKERRAM